MLDNAFPSFLNVFGVRAPGGSLQIPPSWQNGLSSAPLVGEIFGLQVNCLEPSELCALTKKDLHVNRLLVSSRSAGATVGPLSPPTLLWLASSSSPS